MTTIKRALSGVIVLIWRDNGIVCANLEHVLSGLRRPIIDGESVFGGRDGAPVGDLGFEGSFYLPVFDEIFDEIWKGPSSMILGFG